MGARDPGGIHKRWSTVVNGHPFVRTDASGIIISTTVQEGLSFPRLWPVLRRNFVAHLVLAVLAFALVSSVGAGVALHQAGYILAGTAPSRGEACGHDHNETNDQNETGERNETGDRDNETGDHNETGDANDTAEHTWTPGQGE